MKELGRERRCSQSLGCSHDKHGTIEGHGGNGRSHQEPAHKAGTVPHSSPMFAFIPPMAPGTWQAFRKMSVELNSWLNTSDSLQIPESQVGRHLHLLPEKLGLPKKAREATSQQKVPPTPEDPRCLGLSPAILLGGSHQPPALLRKERAKQVTLREVRDRWPNVGERD